MGPRHLCPDGFDALLSNAPLTTRRSEQKCGIRFNVKGAVGFGTDDYRIKRPVKELQGY